MHVLIPSGPGVPTPLLVSDDYLVERFSRSSGPGGQSVNTADSRVELELDVARCPALSPEQGERALRALGRRLVDGRLIVVASEHRSQYRNRVAARDRLAAILAQALAPPPPPRRATKPTHGSQRRRLDAKRRRSQLKTRRARPAAE